MTDLSLSHRDAACRHVLAFFSALDQRRHEEVAALMAADGVWHRQGQALVGPSAVAAALAERDPARETAHIVTNLHAVSEGGRVRVHFYLLAYESRTAPGDDATPRLVSIRSCTDDWVETAAGWRLAQKTSRRHLPPESAPR
ncbi:nuclear transport factor 2 family protein [Pseudomonadota bacterium AL_CKDN230030165-1A_HGKHYDSX7]